MFFWRRNACPPMEGPRPISTAWGQAVSNLISTGDGMTSSRSSFWGRDDHVPLFFLGPGRPRPALLSGAGTTTSRSCACGLWSGRLHFSFILETG